MVQHELVPQPRAEPRITLFQSAESQSLEDQVNAWTADMIRRRRYSGGEVEVIVRGDELLAVVRWMELVQIDFVDPASGMVAYSETPAGLRLEAA